MGRCQQRDRGLVGGKSAMSEKPKVSNRRGRPKGRPDHAQVAAFRAMRVLRSDEADMFPELFGIPGELARHCDTDEDAARVVIRAGLANLRGDTSRIDHKERLLAEKFRRWCEDPSSDAREESFALWKWAQAGCPPDKSPLGPQPLDRRRPWQLFIGGLTSVDDDVQRRAGEALIASAPALKLEAFHDLRQVLSQLVRDRRDLRLLALSLREASLQEAETTDAEIEI